MSVAVQIEERPLAGEPATSDRGVKVRVSVEDTGLGMTEAERSKLFGAFQQADASTSRPSIDLGLGDAAHRKFGEPLNFHIDIAPRHTATRTSGDSEPSAATEPAKF